MSTKHPAPPAHTPTPRTDAAMWSETGTNAGQVVTACFSRQLETELVRAVNAFAPLRNALEKLLHATSRHHNAREVSGPNERHEALENYVDATLKASAALALATPPPEA